MQGTGVDREPEKWYLRVSYKGDFGTLWRDMRIDSDPGSAPAIVWYQCLFTGKE
jgi:hypothetical protein